MPSSSTSACSSTAGRGTSLGRRRSRSGGSEPRRWVLRERRTWLLRSGRWSRDERRWSSRCRSRSGTASGPASAPTSGGDSRRPASSSRRSVILAAVWVVCVRPLGCAFGKGMCGGVLFRVRPNSSRLTVKQQRQHFLSRFCFISLHRHSTEMMQLGPAEIPSNGSA